MTSRDRYYTYYYRFLKDDHEHYIVFDEVEDMNDPAPQQKNTSVRYNLTQTAVATLDKENYKYMDPNGMYYGLNLIT